MEWLGETGHHLEGDILPNGEFAFNKGIVEIDFFCGATLIVEGPALLDIQSDWSVLVDQGRLRANVPPAAHGFIVKAAGYEIIDLGTEFAIEVGSDNARVEVIEGEVEIRGGQHDGKHPLTGESESLRGVFADAKFAEELSTGSGLNQLRNDADGEKFAQWKSAYEKLSADDRLIAYFPIAAGVENRVVPDAASKSNGLLIGPVEQTTGRFGARSTGLAFDRLGSLVRTRINGEFDALTFTCWVKIDSLEHRYNALFMSDGYEIGEPHWQIRDDGRLMFSVMVDDSQEIEHFSEIDQKVVKQAGLHRVYYSDPICDVSKSGQWFHLAAVYDPSGRRVSQFVNGSLASSEKIIDKFHVDQLRIGAAEIGNWGQPFRKSPWFSLRNLNGTIDELAIYKAALPAEEIFTLYQQGNPVGY